MTNPAGEGRIQRRALGRDDTVDAHTLMGRHALEYGIIEIEG